MDEYYIAIPTSLNLERRLSKFPPDFAFSKDYCYYFIAELIRESLKKIQMKTLILMQSLILLFQDLLL